MVRIVKIVVVLASIIFIGETAHAAPTDVKLSFDWSGTYIGVSAAHSWVKLEYSEPDWPVFDRNPNINGFTGDAFLGHNYQVDSLVFGAEADAGFGKLSDDADKSALNYYSAYDIDWNVHVRTRIGSVFDNTLFYAAGGLSLAEVTVGDTEPGWSKDAATHIGWTDGAGVEHAMTKKLRAGTEYLYDDYGSKDYTITGPYSYKANVDLTAHTIRAVLSYNF